MGIKIYKPYTPTSRNKSSLDFSLLTKIKPERSLTVANHRAKGRSIFFKLRVANQSLRLGAGKRIRTLESTPKFN